MAKVSHSNPELDNVLGQHTRKKGKPVVLKESPYHDSPWDDGDEEETGLDESNWSDFGNN
jgi:hypothetical protein